MLETVLSDMTLDLGDSGSGPLWPRETGSTHALRACASYGWQMLGHHTLSSPSNRVHAERPRLRSETGTDWAHALATG
jgi:hypothetical protein